MRNITIPASVLILHSQYLMLRFVDHGLVPVKVVGIDSAELRTHSTVNETVPVNVKNWYDAMKQGKIMINPN